MATGRSNGSLAGGFSWAGANLAPLVLLPLAAVFVYVAIWKIWLPQPTPSAQVVRTVTRTVPAAGTAKGTVKTVSKSTTAATPSRRSETLVIALLLLGAGTAMVGVFYRRVGSIELGKDGVKITLTKAEQGGLGKLVQTLQAGGASTPTLAVGVQQYLDTVAAHRSLVAAPNARARKAVAPEHAELLARAGVAESPVGLTEQQADDLADAIAADLV